jgi:hypothetical protein
MAPSRESSGSGTDASSPPGWLMDAAMARIHEGFLPKEAQSRVLAGPGRGQRCSLCQHAIELGDVGYEVGTLQQGTSAGHLHFHVCCYRAWVKACGSMPRGYSRQPAPASPGTETKRPGT